MSVEQPAVRKLEQARESYERLQKSIGAIYPPLTPQNEIEGQVADVLGKAWSVVCCLENLWEEQTGHKGWQGLWRREALVESERQLLNRLGKLRGAEVHEKGAATSQDLTNRVPITSLYLPLPPHLASVVVQAGPPGTPPAQIARPIYHFEDWPQHLEGDGEILDACSRFVVLVEKGITYFVAEYSELP